MKKIKLEVGQIYQKKGTLEIRVINRFHSLHVWYTDIGGITNVMRRNSFRRWCKRGDVELIGIYDCEMRKARKVK